MLNNTVCLRSKGTRLNRTAANAVERLLKMIGMYERDSITGKILYYEDPTLYSVL